MRSKEPIMQNTPLLTQRIWYYAPYVMPATVLSPEPTHENDPSSLRAAASSDGICYVKLIQSFHDGTYLARVAASPDALRSHSYIIVLNDAQLAKVRPWHGLLTKSA
jgi:hypothetical protein